MSAATSTRATMAPRARMDMRCDHGACDGAQVAVMVCAQITTGGEIRPLCARHGDEFAEDMRGIGAAVLVIPAGHVTGLDWQAI